MSTTRDSNPPQAEAAEKRAYERPAIVWEETLEIAGTLRASSIQGEPGCGDQD